MSAAWRQPTTSLGKDRRHGADGRRCGGDGCVRRVTPREITAGTVPTEKPRESGRHRPLELRHFTAISSSPPAPNGAEQAAHRRIGYAITRHQEPHQRVLKELEKTRLLKLNMHG